MKRKAGKPLYPTYRMLYAIIGSDYHFLASQSIRKAHYSAIRALLPSFRSY